MRLARTIFPLASVALVSVIVGTTRAQSAPSFPFEVQLLESLGFRTSPGLGGSFVIPGNNYLDAGSRVKMTGANGPLWQPNTFCQAEFQGKRGWIRCDKPAALKILQSAQPPPTTAKTAPPAPATTTPAPTTATPAGAATSTASASTAPAKAQCMDQAQVQPGRGLKLCTDVASCVAFCQCACTFNPSKWGIDGEGYKVDTSTDCPRAAQTGEGMIPESSPLLQPIPKLTYVLAGSSVRATQLVIDGLKKLDAFAGTQPWKSQYRVRVNNCYREHTRDTVAECGFVLKAQHVFKKYGTKPASGEGKTQWEDAERWKDPPKMGLSYPGATPHSAGNACDMVMVDISSGKEDEQFGCAAKDDAKTRQASRWLDEAVTRSGGRRLSFEAWHYEWAGTMEKRCTFPECDKYWPPKCRQ